MVLRSLLLRRSENGNGIDDIEHWHWIVGVIKSTSCIISRRAISDPIS
jgi:hypothetical protein